MATVRNHRRLRPRDFLKRRRPGYFSDTPAASRPRLDRTVLEYHLSTLTSRSQELDFEKFALALCKRTICPNLVPHTGPSGGGDSKVDTETYPVSSDLALAWHVGEPERSSRERWGFAFSAKADWKPKVEADIAKIIQTGRPYERAFFVSSQMIPDRVRAKVEDRLRTTHGLDVRVLDRNWMLDRVFEGHLEELAADELRLQIELRESPRPGPLDASRQNRLAELDEEIQLATQAQAVGPRVVDLAIEAAVTARHLERPREEVEGRLDRADRLARGGFSEQQAQIAYERAWTAYWWNEDGPTFARHVEDHERIAGTSPGIPALRRLTALYYLASAGIAGSWTARSEWMRARRGVIDSAVERIAGTETAPSAALSARMIAAMVAALDDPEHADHAYRAMAALVDDAAGLIGFPFDEFAQELSELGSVIPASDAFDALHARVVEEVQHRTGDIAAGELHAERASQLYDSARYAQAISSAGKALPLLVRHEARESLMRALDVIAESYLQMGLPWAARGAWLLAASVAGSESVSSAAELPRLVAVLDRLRGVELVLGRLPQALSVHRIYTAAASAVAVDTPTLHDRLQESDAHFEIALAYSLMRVPQGVLAQLVRVPDLLERYHLDLARGALLFAIGRQDEVTDALGNREKALELFRELRDLPDGPRLRGDHLSPTDGVRTDSRVLGVTITLEHDPGSPGTEIAESCLGAIEALLATGAGLGIIGKVPDVRLRVRHAPSTPWPFRIVNTVDGSEPLIEIEYAEFDPAALTGPEQAAIRIPLREIVARVLVDGFFFDQTEDTLNQLLGDERALDRSLNFGASFVTAGDLMAGTHSSGLEGLFDGLERVYEFGPHFKEWTEPTSLPSRKGRRNGEPNLDLSTVPHNRIRVLRTVIDTSLWDQAGWKGVLFAVQQGAPPLLALVFTDEEPARRIWEGWQQQVGANSLDDLVAISIVTGVNPLRSFDYRVLVAPIWNRATDGQDEVVIDAVRVHEMNPESDTNLATFRDAYAEAGRFYLGFGHLALLGTPDGVRPIGRAPMSSIAIRARDELDEGDWERAILEIH